MVLTIFPKTSNHVVSFGDHLAQVEQNARPGAAIPARPSLRPPRPTCARALCGGSQDLFGPPALGPPGVLCCDCVGTAAVDPLLGPDQRCDRRLWILVATVRPLTGAIHGPRGHTARTVGGHIARMGPVSSEGWLAVLDPFDHFLLPWHCCIMFRAVFRYSFAFHRAVWHHPASDRVDVRLPPCNHLRMLLALPQPHLETPRQCGIQWPLWSSLGAGSGGPSNGSEGGWSFSWSTRSNWSRCTNSSTGNDSGTEPRHRRWGEPKCHGTVAAVAQRPPGSLSPPFIRSHLKAVWCRRGRKQLGTGDSKWKPLLSGYDSPKAGVSGQRADSVSGRASKFNGVERGIDEVKKIICRLETGWFNVGGVLSWWPWHH